MQFQYSAEQLQLQLPSLCFLIAIFVASLIVFTKRGRNAASRRNIPGPWMLPIIGSLHHLIGSELPHRRLRTLALRYGPDLMLMRLGQVDNVVVSSQEAARDALGTRDLDFSSRPRTAALGVLTYGYTNVVFSPYGSYWMQLRKICVTELLTADREKSFFGSVRREEILNLAKEIRASCGRPVDLGRKLESLSYAISFRAMVGKKCRLRRGQEEEFFSIMKETAKVVFDATFSDMFPSFMKFLDVVSGANCRRKRLHGALDEALDEIVEEHEKALPSKNGEEEDLTDVLLRLKESDKLDIPLTRENIKAVLADLYGAGTNNSSTTIEWAMAELMKNPEIMQKAQREIRQEVAGKTNLEEKDVANLNYLKLVIKETLRLHPPVPLIPRECIESCQVHGYTIPRGRRILVNLWALGTDPKHWEEPDEFRPERFDGSSIDFRGSDFCYLPFGGGRRMCPGIAFTMATVELTLAYLLNYFDWELADGKKADELDMTEKISVTLSRKSELNLIASIRVPLPADV